MTGNPVGSHQLLWEPQAIDQCHLVTTAPDPPPTSHKTLTEVLAAARLSLHPSVNQTRPPSPVPTTPPSSHRDQEGAPPLDLDLILETEVGMDYHQVEPQDPMTVAVSQNLSCQSPQSMVNTWNVPLMMKNGVGSMRLSLPLVSIVKGFKNSVTCVNATGKDVLFSRDSSDGSAIWRMVTGILSEDCTKAASAMAGVALLHTHDQALIANRQLADSLVPGPGEFELVDVIVEDEGSLSAKPKPSPDSLIELLISMCNYPQLQKWHFVNYSEQEL